MKNERFKTALKAVNFILALVGIVYLVHHHADKNPTPLDRGVETVTVILVCHLLMMIFEPHNWVQEILKKLDDAIDAIKQLTEYIIDHVVFRNVHRATTEEDPAVLENFTFDADVLRKAKSGDTVYVDATYLAGFDKSVTEFRNALASGIKFRFIILHPDSSAVGLRAAQIKKPKRISNEEYQQGIVEFQEQLTKVKNTLPKGSEQDAIQIRYQQIPPCGPKYLIETKNEKVKRVIQGFYLQTLSTKGLHLLWLPGISRDQTRELQAHIHAVWESLN